MTVAAADTRRKTHDRWRHRYAVERARTWRTPAPTATSAVATGVGGGIWTAVATHLPWGAEAGIGAGVALAGALLPWGVAYAANVVVASGAVIREQLSAIEARLDQSVVTGEDTVERRSDPVLVLRAAQILLTDISGAVNNIEQVVRFAQWGNYTFGREKFEQWEEVLVSDAEMIEAVRPAQLITITIQNMYHPARSLTGAEHNQLVSLAPKLAAARDNLKNIIDRRNRETAGSVSSALGE